MMWPLLVAFGAFLCVGLGGLSVVLMHRHRVKHMPGVFACRVAPGDVIDAKYPRRPFPRTRSYGVWARDILLVYRGPTLLQLKPLPIVSAHGAPFSPKRPVKRLGTDVVALVLEVDDGSRVTVAANAGSGQALVGPFLIAGLGLPRRNSAMTVTDSTRRRHKA